MSNPLTQDQLRRVDAWIAEHACGWSKWEFLGKTPGDSVVCILAPERVSWLSEGTERTVPTDKPFTEAYPDIPKFTSPDSPRRLLEEAEERCRTGRESKWVCAIHWVTCMDTSGSFDRHHIRSLGTCPAYSLSDALRIGSATILQRIHAIVLVRGGNWAEVVDGQG